MVYLGFLFLALLAELVDAVGSKPISIRSTGSIPVKSIAFVFSILLKLLIYLNLKILN